MTPDRLARDANTDAETRRDVPSTINFSVASALFRELGERLVGKPHIALAELVKNSYDADATHVTIRFNADRIEVVDNGHGMNFEDFKNFWMRIGSPHKQTQRFSRTLLRPMTGSKGVGRLAVQFLARQLELRTVSADDPGSQLTATVDWDEAVEAGDLTQAVARYTQTAATTTFPGAKPHGTEIILTRLNQKWTPEELESLAQEIWTLQPPFRPNPNLKTDQQKAFDVDLEGLDREVVARFKAQMQAFLELWHAKLVGALTIRGARQHPIGSVQLSLEFAGSEPVKTTYEIPGCKLRSAEFEIRVFHLKHRQRHGIKVEEFREYLNDHGGVHIYDAGFHLPYAATDDWLRTEIDHAHRLSKSKLLPAELQVPEGMNYLPTMSRLFGIVHVNTAKEHTEAKKIGLESSGEVLTIQVTRDRLVDNKVYQDLQFAVRWALDFYAMQEATRALHEAEASRPVEPAREKFRRVDEVLSSYAEQIAAPAYSALRKEVREAVSASESEAEVMARQVGLLGPLATAGMSALALEHEINQQLALVQEVVNEIGMIDVPDRQIRKRLRDLEARLAEWIGRVKGTRTLFSFLMDEENRSRHGRLKAAAVVRQVKEQMAILTRGIEIDSRELDSTLHLPGGSLSEWSAIFQNVFANAVNAMLEARRKLLVVGSRAKGRNRFIVVQDTGVGVDLSAAEELFKPFVRRLNISPERRALGMGGTGLGLTIVRMVAENLGCKVGFVEPAKGFSTAFQLSWSETK